MRVRANNASGGGGGLADASMTSSSVTYTGGTSDCDTILFGEIHINTTVANYGIIGTVSPAPANDTVGVATLKNDISGRRVVKLKTNGELVNEGGNTMVAGYDWEFKLAYKKA